MRNHFTFAQFQFDLEAVESLEFPAYKGSTLRGAFGTTFKKVVCALRTRTCADCLLNERCVYSYIFETPSPANRPDREQYNPAPHPFVILPPLDKKTCYAPGETISFTLTLIGKALDYVPYFIYTFHELGESGIGRARGRFKLQRVLRMNGAEHRLVYDGEGKILTGAYEATSWQTIVEKHPHTRPAVTLRFLTPVRIRLKDDLVLDLDFPIFFKSLVRRIEALASFHCGGTPESTIKDLIRKSAAIQTQQRALTWYDWERYSNRQETKMKLGGFVGDITFAGDLGPFMPYMLLGEYIHVGKGTSFGLGKYEIVKE